MMAAPTPLMSSEWQHVAVQGRQIFEALAAADVIEVCVNEPGTLWVETRSGWSQRDAAECSLVRLKAFVAAVATATRQSASETKPLLSATLIGGERLQAVLAPAVEIGSISLTIRKPSVKSFAIEELEATGLFTDVRVSGGKRAAGADDARLSQLLSDGEIGAFLRGAVKAKQNILISGATGSGKTTLSKALIREIGADERIITIEDTPELVVPQANRVSLRYSKDGQGLANVGAKELLEASLRMRPDRILLQELRDGTAFYYIRNVNSGHPGSITTVHADSCALAFEQLTLLVKESAGGRDLARDDIRGLLTAAVDVVVQCKRIGGSFRVTEIDFVASRRATGGVCVLENPGLSGDGS
jgi:type IV secretion system protein VirB11